MNSLSKRIQILDCTLREGEQSKNILFSLNEKLHIVELLKSFGVNHIEIGHAGISEQERFICQKICSSSADVEFLVHARAVNTDIIAAHSTGATWVGIWVSCNDIALENKFTNKSFEWIIEQVKNSVTLAKNLGLKVRLTIEDASRTPLEQIIITADVATQAGADRISLADTVGAWSPQACYKVIKAIAENFSCDIEVHLHNDLNLAIANAVAAIEAGATIIDTSILGVGERAGICDLFSLAIYLHKFHHHNNYRFEFTQTLQRTIQQIGHFSLAPHHPIVGQNVFTHTAKYHVKAAEKNVVAYQFLDPKLFHRNPELLPKQLERKSYNRLEKSLQIGKPFIKSSSELRYHRDGIGKRWVCMDNRIDERSSLYVIERIFNDQEKELYQPHVDRHAHHCDSVFIFLGDNEDGTGLTVIIKFGQGISEEIKTINSPASIFIPAMVYHSYEYISGSGRFTNIVLAPSYNDSLV